MIYYTDQVGRRITIHKIPKRIISVVPSQTELLFDLGLDEEVIGITKFCIYPEEWFQTKTRVGGTKQLKMEVIHQLQPDLIIANKEENTKEHIEELEKYYPVWVSDVNNLEDAYTMIAQIGVITGKEEKAKAMTTAIINEFSSLSQKETLITACYLIWQKPYMTIGGDTFIHAMLEAAGFKNIFKNKLRYPETTIQEIKKLKPDVVLLSSEPFPFRQKHIDELKAQLPDTKIFPADGEMFSWYGSRLLKAPVYFKKLYGQIVRP